MTRLTDGKNTVGISMMEWKLYGLSPDWSNDFFDVGLLPFVEDENGDHVYIVDDVQYCIEQANEWMMEDEENNIVHIDILRGVANHDADIDQK